MKCEDVLTALQRTDTSADLVKRAAAEHLSRCEDCRNAAHAFAVLRADRDLPIALPDDHVFRQAIAVAAGRAEVGPRRSFWSGVGVGAALAAGLALAIVAFRPAQPPGASSATPQVVLAVNDPRDVSVALSSPEALAGAEIRIALSGDIALRGFDGERELRWTTDLDRGVNELTLPLIGLRAGKGQVLVEVEHDDKRRAFVVDVMTTGGEPAAALWSKCAASSAREKGNADIPRSCV